MSKSFFYADLDLINGKGVLVTGHGKGLVNKNPDVNGEYVASDMVRLTAADGKLFGYQGYVEKSENELTEIEYALYFYYLTESGQPSEPARISAEEYLRLSAHNIHLSGGFEEYEAILKQASFVRFISVPWTADENDRVRFVNDLVK